MWVVGLVLLAIECAQALVRLDPLVDSPAGLIRGVRADDGEYSLFLGIPYAKVKDDNPFGASIPQPKFNGIFDAFNDANVCPQVGENDNTIMGTLDCLQLNVYVPNTATSRNKLPVLVWIHGGGFTSGYTSRFMYGPKYLVRNDVIMVALNYRVGPYGFFCLDTPEIPGNQGLKDQVLALRWVRDNIAAFGGDVNKITVMGESAGGVSIEYHLLSKYEKLFNQAITQSGSIFLGLLEEDGRSKPLRIAAHLGFDTEDVNEAVAFLAKTNLQLVIAATTELGIRTMPCIEKEFENVDNILTEHPINLDMPKAKNINVLVGFSNKEHLLGYVAMPADQFKNLNVFEDALQKKYIYDEELKEMENIARRFYIGDEELSSALRDNLIDFQSDFDFVFPIQQSIKKYLENGANNIFYYMFSYSGDRNFAKKRANVTTPGAAHVDELGYLYDLSYETEEPTEADQLVIDRITALWTNFVKYGDPTPQTSTLLPVKWSPISEQTYTYLNIDSELSVSTRPYNDRMAFWELFDDVNKNKLKGYREN